MKQIYIKIEEFNKNIIIYFYPRLFLKKKVVLSHNRSEYRYDFLLFLKSIFFLFSLIARFYTIILLSPMVICIDKGLDFSSLNGFLLNPTAGGVVAFGCVETGCTNSILSPNDCFIC